MTDTPAPNDMPEEIPLRQFISVDRNGNRVFDLKAFAATPEGRERLLMLFNRSRADLTAPEAVGGEALNWKRQKETVFAWAAEHGFTCVESEIVDLLSALQHPPATAVDLEALIRDTALVAQNIDDGSGPHKQDVEWVIRHLAAQGMIKGRG